MTATLYRTGRRNGHTIYRVADPAGEPSDEDVFVGSAVSPGEASRLVAAADTSLSTHLVVVVGSYATAPTVQSWGPLHDDGDGAALNRLCEQAKRERGEWVTMTGHLLTPPSVP